MGKKTHITYPSFGGFPLFFPKILENKLKSLINPKLSRLAGKKRIFWISIKGSLKTIHKTINVLHRILRINPNTFLP